MAPTAGQEEADEASRSQNAGRRHPPAARHEEASRSQCEASRRLPASRHEGAGEASGCRFWVSRRRRSPAIRASPTVERGSRSEDEHWEKRKRSRDAKQPSSKPKKYRVEEDTVRSKKREKARAEDETMPPSGPAVRDDGCSSDASSAGSSPVSVCWPFWDPALQGGGMKMWDTVDSETHDVYDELNMKYHEKIFRQEKLVTLDIQLPQSCLVDKALLPVRESATKMILQVARAVVGLSSYVDNKLLNRSSGFLIKWGEEGKASTILTSAHLIRLNSPSIDEWSGQHQYVFDAKVLVHLLDSEETAVVANLLYYDKHYNLALFRVNMDLEAQIPRFRNEVMCSQGVFVLGRDANLNLMVDHGNVQYEGPGIYSRHHYMFFGCVIAQKKSSSLTSKARSSSSYQQGRKVSGRSVAEKVGIRAGDIIECLNGKCIATTVELENMLMSICEDLLDKGEDIGSTFDMTADVFQIRKKKCMVPKVCY